MMAGALQQARLLAANPAATAMTLAAARHKSEAGVKTESAAREKQEAESKITIDVVKGTMSAQDVPVENFEKRLSDVAGQPYNELSQIMGRVKAARQLKSGATATADTAATDTPPAAVSQDREQKRIEELTAGVDPEAVRKELSTREGIIRSSIELGATSQRKAEWDARRILSGDLPLETAVKKLITRRQAELDDLMSRSEGRQKDASDREKAVRDQEKAVLAARKAARTEIEQSDLKTLTPEDVAARAGVDPSMVESDVGLTAAMKSKRDDLTLKLARERAADAQKRIDSMDEKDIGGTFEEWRDAQGVDFTPARERIARSRFTELRNIRAQRAEDQNFQRTRFDERNDTKPPKPPKPQKPTRSWTSDDLVTNKGNEDYDQDALGRFANTRLASIASKINKNNSKISILRAEATALRKEAADESRIAGKEAEIEALKSTNGTLFEEKELLRDAGFGGKVQTFPPRIEKAIDAYMKAKKYGPDRRASAIEELRDLGELE